MNKLKILLIEDDDDIRESIHDYLEMEDHEVVSAIHGKDALAKLKSSPDLPDMIFLDLNMPVMPGKEFIEIIQNDKQYKDIPIVVMTAVPNVNIEKVWKFLNKPVDLDVIADIIKNFRN